MSVFTTARIHFADDNIVSGLSLPALGATDNPKAGVVGRVVVLEDEDSRECPSQGANEIAREKLFLRGADERRGHGFGSLMRSASPTRHLLHLRAGGHRRQFTGSFREQRDSNSFDAYDCKCFRTIVFV